MKYRKKPAVVDVVECFLGYEVLSNTVWQSRKGIPFTEISIKTIDSVAKAVNDDHINKGMV